MKLVIGRPVLDAVEALSEKSLILAIGNTSGHKLFYIPAFGNSVIHETRNELVNEAYKFGFDAICMIDSDMVFPPDTIQRLASHDKDIVGVLYSSRVKEGLQNAFTYNPSKNTYVRTHLKNKSGLHKVDAVGTGIIFIKREVFEAVRAPYFFYGTDFSEDINFCHRARECGFDVFVDTDIQVGHIGKTQYIIK